MEQMIKRYLASLAFMLLVASSCGQPIIMGPSIAMKGQSNTQLERDEAECKLAAEIDEKKNPEKYQKEAGGFLKSGYAFLPSKHFQACMIARGYKTEVDVQFFRVGVGTGIYYYDVNAKREKTEEAVWNDLRECHKVIMETDIKGGEKAGAAAALIIPLGGIIQGFLVDKIIKRTFVPCITDREYVVVETKENTDDDGWKETPVATAPQPQPQVTPPPTKVTPAPTTASTAPSKVTPTKSAEQLGMEQRLQKLMELRQKNLITNEEYQKAKEKVLKKLTE